MHDGVKYSCDECDKIYSYFHCLKEHKETIHDGVKYACDQCEYEANQKIQLEHHKIKKHNGIKYSCDQCKYITYHRKGIYQHKRSQHNGIIYQTSSEVELKFKREIFQCILCIYSTSKQDDLKSHIDSIHKIIQFSCSQCEYQFTDHQSLREHKKGCPISLI